MLPKQLFATASALALGVLLSANAKSVDPIRLGSHEVHPTRLLARSIGDLKSPQVQQQSAATLAAVGMKISRTYPLVPGLVALETVDNRVGTAAVVSSEEQAQRLMDRLVQLRDSGLFVYVEPDYVRHISVTPSDPKFIDGALWGLQNNGQDSGRAGIDIGAASAWEISTGSTNVIVAVIDTGVRYTHADLKSQMWVNEGETGSDGLGRDKRKNGLDDDGNGVIDDVYGFDATTGTGDPFDDNDHGSHVAGTIGAAANNGYPHVGVTWNIRIMACKLFNSTGSGGGGFTADAVDCLNYAVKMGAKISNNSWGGGGFSTALFDAIRQAGLQGHLFIAAAGNSSADNDLFPSYPANLPLDNVLSVAAIDRKGLLASFSNYGRRTVHIAAPGVDIYSCSAQSDLSYASFSGTSMACPHVAGVAALIAAAHPNADMTEIRERILISAVTIPSAATTTSTGGMVNAFKAIQAASDGILETSANPPTGSSLLVGATSPLYIKLTDVVPVLSGSVTATVEGAGIFAQGMNFTDDGVAPDQIAGDAIYSSLIPAPSVEGAVTIKVTAFAPGKETKETTLSYSAGGRPANDNFGKPRKIATAGQILSDTTRYSTSEINEPVHAKVPSAVGSLWYAWSPSITGNALIETVGSAIDTYIAVYTGDTLLTLKEITSIDNDGAKKNGSLVVPIKAGNTYRIAVGGVNIGQDGSIRLRVLPNAVPDNLPPVVTILSPSIGVVTTSGTIDISGSAVDQDPNPSGLTEILVKVNENLSEPAEGTESWRKRGIRLRPGINSIEVRAADISENVSQPSRITVNYVTDTLVNDHLSNASPLSGTEGKLTANSLSASREFGEPLHAGNQGGRSIWYTFVPPANGILTLDTQGSNFDTVVAVYTGNRLASLESLGSNDDATPGAGYSRLEQAVEGGTVVRIALDGFAGQAGTVELAYSFTPRNLRRLIVQPSAGGNVDIGSGLFPEGASIVIRALPDSRHEFVQWSGSLVSYDDSLEFPITTDTTLKPIFQERRYSDPFEEGFANLPYTSGGASAWTISDKAAAFGNSSAKAGEVEDGQFSSLILKASVRAGIATFEYKVSSEEGWDWFEFYVDGVLQSRWTGEVDWTPYALSVNPGVRTFEWRYSKDVARSAGLDTAFIDNLVVPTQPAVDGGSAAKLSLAEVKNGIARIRIEGQIGQTYETQVSSDLVQWRTLRTDVNEKGFIFVTDTESTVNRGRFYRAVVR